MAALPPRAASPIAALLATLVGASLASAAPAPTTRQLAPRPGAQVPVDAFLPPGTGEVPTLVMAPGQGYHRGLPLVAQLGERGRRAGLAVFTFDWAYRAAQGQPSEDLEVEAQDVEAVLAHVLAHPRVDPRRVFLAGKSLGSLVAYKVFRRRPDLAGLMLWTPVCSRRYDDEGQRLDDPEEAGEENYPAIEAESRPVGVFLGDADPLCPLPFLYDWLDDSNGNVAVQVFAGDHSLNLGRWDDASLALIHAKNRAAAHRGALHWVESTLGRPAR